VISQPRVLITGTSSGIGFLLAQRLATRGYRVFGTSRRDAAPVDGVTVLHLDVTNDNSVIACVEAMFRLVGGIDILVNNAGRLDEGPLEEFSAADLHTVFDTNVFGAARVTNAVLPAMRAQRSGRIVNVSSLAGLMPVPFMGAYCASKHALESYSESLRYELRPLGIHVSLIEPGYFRTGLADRKHRKTPSISDYDPQRQAAFATFDGDERTAADPSPVIDRLVRILESRRPRLRYPLGRYTLNYFLRGVTPEWIWEYGVRKTIG
jgi:NAD(P)-dependent dehydrogenase (short-subunit alcohol dehydrogenase family)